MAEYKKKISLDEFRHLPEQEQYDVTLSKGDFLASKIYGDQWFALYAVDLFFVEVEYDDEKKSVVGQKGFIGGELLNKYSFSSNEI